MIWSPWCPLSLGRSLKEALYCTRLAEFRQIRSGRKRERDLRQKRAANHAEGSDAGLRCDCEIEGQTGSGFFSSFCFQWMFPPIVPISIVSAKHFIQTSVEFSTFGRYFCTQRSLCPPCTSLKQFDEPRKLDRWWGVKFRAFALNLCSIFASSQMLDKAVIYLFYFLENCNCL